MKKYVVAVAISISSLAYAQNNFQATPQPKNLAVAAGQYAGAVAYSNVVKRSACGFAFTREPKAIKAAISNEIAPLFNKEDRQEVIRTLSEMEGMMVNQANSMLSNSYSHYTKTEKLDHNTACGMVAANAISIQKLTFEAMQRSVQ